MKLNPSKCSFGVDEGKFLGVLFTKEGFRANPEKIEALIQMEPPRNFKEVQRLNGRLIALNRFLSKFTDKTLPFMAVLRRCMKKNKFCWDREADEAFRELKSHLCELPLITSPRPGEALTLIYPAQIKRLAPH
ncbi:putative mitochondrial protein AtMg00860 [Bidens hawaiensis]|uniref:putative mitochondrial protein AtMg00860 n=1 Tax=Bidens hawaiensis TaxID=980011 RepID=UPI00404B92F8